MALAACFVPEAVSVIAGKRNHRQLTLPAVAV